MLKLSPVVMVLLYLTAALIASIPPLFLPLKDFGTGAAMYTHYNNYVIFRNAYFHLLDGKDLYALWPTEQWDLFKYSPTFALCFSPFAQLPDGLGLPLWNVLNSGVLAIGIWRLQRIGVGRIGAFYLFVFIEMLTSIQNAQSNALIAGLLLLALVDLEEDRSLTAALYIALTVFIKIFGLVFLLPVLFYNSRWRFALWFIIFSVLLLLLPLVVVPAERLLFLYRSWQAMLANDRAISEGLSVMGWLNSWFGWRPAKGLVTVTGAGLLLIPLVRYKLWGVRLFRLRYAALVLIWMLIFNHRAESATFVIAVSGAGLYFFSKELLRYSDLLLMALLFVFTILSPTDLFPAYLRAHFIIPYVMKAVPCIILWVVIWVQLLTQQSEYDLP